MRYERPIGEPAPGGGADGRSPPSTNGLSGAGSGSDAGRCTSDSVFCSASAASAKEPSSNETRFFLFFFFFFFASHASADGASSLRSPNVTRRLEPREERAVGDSGFEAELLRRSAERGEDGADAGADPPSSPRGISRLLKFASVSMDSGVRRSSRASLDPMQPISSSCLLRRARREKGVIEMARPRGKK